MNLQYAFFFNNGGGETNALSVPHANAANFDYFAAGAFDGGDDLPTVGTMLNSTGDFESYLTALEAKTTEISAIPLNISVISVTTQYVVLGGTGADVVTTDSTTTADGLMIGRSGDDSLTGGSGHNTLEGGAGDDTLVSRGTGDKLIGGPGADHIEIIGLVQADAANVGALSVGDVLDFSGAAASLGLADFKAVTHFHGHAGDVKAHFHAAGDHTAFVFDTDGDGVADHRVVVRGGDYSDYAQVAGVTISTHIAIHPDAHALVV